METITTPVSGVLLLVTIGVRLDLDNEPQPDAVLMIEEQAGGQARLSEDDYIEGAPELVAEIAASSAAIDLGDKKRAYRRNGIREYIVWQVFEQRLDWFYLQEGEYVPLPVDENGVIRSQVFPGLWLAANDLLGWEYGASVSCVAGRVGCTGTYRICAAAIELARVLRSVDAVQLIVRPQSLGRGITDRLSVRLNR